MTEKEEATALKVQGNKAFAQHDWRGAVDYYTKAIDKYDHDPSFFCNRAQVGCPVILVRISEANHTTQANIKLESYGYAIVDSTAAIKLDPSYVKVSQ